MSSHHKEVPRSEMLYHGTSTRDRLAEALQDGWSMSTDLAQLEKGRGIFAPADFGSLYHRRSRLGAWTEERKTETLAFVEKVYGRSSSCGFIFGRSLLIVFGVLDKPPTLHDFLWQAAPTVLSCAYLFALSAQLIAYFGLPRWLTFGYEIGPWLPTDPDESLFVEGPGSWPIWVHEWRRWLGVIFSSSCSVWTVERKADTLNIVRGVRITLIVTGLIIGHLLSILIFLKGSDHQRAIFMCFSMPMMTCCGWLFAIFAELLAYFGLPKWLTFGYKLGGSLPVDPDESLIVEGGEFGRCRYAR
ncbi:hypothetical protein EJ03DRAFT_45841 [Teratosphaeria nubilosa]|uniref:Uncharacterized protein n=1 Tax=Teratosphaeria nubilosa TaxID=161662 RepID=A0A6G1LG36_9PEZI|nr:hypothetical protein EJ03DRAFT_45841 [Teratosphaeria nubilosa]